MDDWCGAVKQALDCATTATPLPSPWGEGQGEGKGSMVRPGALDLPDTQNRYSPWGRGRTNSQRLCGRETSGWRGGTRGQGCPRSAAFK